MSIRDHSVGPRSWATILIAGALAGSLAGCAPAPAGREQAEPAPLHGGTLRILQERPRSLDPRASDSVYESLPVNQLFDTLVNIDPSLTVKPGLAETWTISRSGTEYTFRLRSGVRFHDGAPLTAEDVVFSFCRVLCPKDGTATVATPFLKMIEGADDFAAGEREQIHGLEVLDDRTLRIRLSRPYPSFLEVLTMDNLAVVPERVVREIGSEAYGRAPVGTGPFRLAEWSEASLRLEANPEHFAGRPYLDAVEIQFPDVAETDFGVARFRNRAIDVVEPPTDSIAELASDRAVRLHRYQELSLSFLGLNTRLPPLDQPKVRQAIAHALNRERLVLDSPEMRREAVGILPPGISGYSPDPKTLQYDPEKARRLLAEAGYPGGRGLPAVRLLSPSTSTAVKRVIELMKSELAEVGIELELVPVTWAEVSRQLDENIAPAFLIGWVADLTDPDAFLRSLFEADGSGNYFGHQSTETQALLDRGLRVSNPVERSRIYRRLERQVLESVPLVPLYHSVGVIAVRNEVEGLTPSPLGLARVEFERVWLRKAPA